MGGNPSIVDSIAPGTNVPVGIELSSCGTFHPRTRTCTSPRALREGTGGGRTAFRRRGFGLGGTLWLALRRGQAALSTTSPCRDGSMQETSVRGGTVFRREEPEYDRPPPPTHTPPTHIRHATHPPTQAPNHTQPPHTPTRTRGRQKAQVQQRQQWPAQKDTQVWSLYRELPTRAAVVGFLPE